ncbi:acetohydroxyacid synthase small subunit [Chryseobacterium piperi]|uniref:Acetolactate synthase small subunit n=1 Tax=Chryseobacterium piperi TaxID=558152 RepID=A0A086BJW2_9FLAO|nr:acetolactate synthase small subunit [Chryseobacterium piperi]ASW73781.1 acetolactate synthase small subunit [Chryseobacterium piperi]KFF29226.1 acetohydroxyacid synthase small subunit [Chryseobacterium piperi]
MSKREYTISVFTENQVGLLTRIAMVFSRRGINIESLNVSPTEIESISRFTIVVDVTEETVRKISRQIQKLVEVLKVYYNTHEEIVWQELALFKIETNVVSEKFYVERVLRQYGATIVSVRNDYTVFTIVGHREEIDNFLKIVEPHGLIEFIRSGRVAVIKSNEGFHKKLNALEKIAYQ